MHSFYFLLLPQIANTSVNLATNTLGQQPMSNSISLQDHQSIVHACDFADFEGNILISQKSHIPWGQCCHQILPPLLYAPHL